MKPSEDLRSLQLTLGLYLIIFALKLVAYFFSGVLAVLAEALHTLSDIFIAAFLLIAAVYSRRAADQRHNFGYGRAENVAALVAATIFISFTSFELYREAIPHLLEGYTPEYQNLPLAVGVLAVSILIAGAPLLQLLRQKNRGAAAHAQFMELINDELGLVAALVGTLLAALAGWSWADPLAAIVVATIIAVNAAGLFRENLSMLLGRSPEPKFMEKLKTLVLATPPVVGVHDVRAEYVGPEVIHVDLHIEVPRTLTVGEGDEVAEKVMNRLQRELGIGYVAIHTDAQEQPAA
ncbi:MAG: cation transporter [Anaerolineales bacterium]|nr:cation transporter [Anaerolineales bacterium]